MHITAGPGISRAFILGAGLGTFPERSWNSCPVHFSHEPVLLDSGGRGEEDREPLASAEEPLLVINGDMAATFDLRRVMEDHVRHPSGLSLPCSAHPSRGGSVFGGTRGLPA